MSLCEKSSSSLRAEPVSETDLLAGLSDSDRRRLLDECVIVGLRRGDTVVNEGEPPDSLYIVLSGRFAVQVGDDATTICEIGPGQPIGEIAFFIGGNRTATVRALRDSRVLRLEREDFNALSRECPAIWSAIAAALARRVSNGRNAVETAKTSRPRTIALIPAGSSAINERFIARLASALATVGPARIIRETDIASITGNGTSLDSARSTDAFNEIESRYETIVYVTGQSVDAWADKAIRQSDIALFAGTYVDNAALNGLERLASSYIKPSARRLALCHPVRTVLSGTKRWLSGRDIAMHHHIAGDNDEDIARLVRFINGSAIGLVACGGGALCAAHVGVYEALIDSGARFDIMGGTSAGSAFTAAFALATKPADVDRAIHDMFVTNRAMRRYTLPRYSLLDHANFDRQLERYFGGIDIEDLWIPFFAVSTNLSSYTLHVHRRGSLWRAIRASSSIPVLLPPLYTPEGYMLVDGCLLDNVPVSTMHTLKTGPNVVVSFDVPELERFDVVYENLPSRNGLVLSTLGLRTLPEAPGLTTVLMRSLMANRQDFRRHLTPNDLLLIPPIPSGAGFLDWHRHTELADVAGRWTRAELQSVASANHPALTRIKSPAECPQKPPDTLPAHTEETAALD